MIFDQPVVIRADVDLKKDLKKVLTVEYSTTEPEQWRAMATLAIFISLSSGLSKRMLENW